MLHEIVSRTTPSQSPGKHSKQRERSMLKWFHRLMPREEGFFELFERHAQIILAAAEALKELLRGGENVPSNCKLIFDREAEADQLIREVLTAVRRTFITPFDRSDIQDLITSMDDAIDQMNKTAKTIVLYEVRTFDPAMQQMGDSIYQASRLVLEAVPLLRSVGKNADHLAVLTERIVQVEERADQLYDQGRKALFLSARTGNADQNAMSFIVGTEIYDHLEKVVDRFEDVANEINALVTDHL